MEFQILSGVCIALIAAIVTSIIYVNKTIGKHIHCDESWHNDAVERLARVETRIERLPTIEQKLDRLLEKNGLGPK